MDIGYHFDLSEIVMSERGFSPLACQLALFGNGMTDVIGNFATSDAVKPALDVLKQQGGIPKSLAERAVNASKLHFDNLFKNSEVEGYRHQILANLKREIDSVDSTANAKEVGRKILVAIGVTLHATQDFCSHSTFSASLPPVKVKTAADTEASFLTTYNRRSPLQSFAGLSPIVTGAYHPDQGIVVPDNHPTHDTHHLDHQDRKLTDPPITGVRTTSWDEGYIAAFVGCHELLATIDAWIAAAGWNKAQQSELKAPSLSPLEQRELADALDLLTYIFMWLHIEGSATDSSGHRADHHDGHWKGPGSGSTESLAGNIAASIAFAVQRFSQPSATIAIGEVCMAIAGLTPIVTPLIELLSSNSLPGKLYSDSMGTAPANQITTVEKFETPFSAFSMRVEKLSIENGLASRFRLGRFDPYLKVEIIELADELMVGAKTYRERTLQEWTGATGKRVGPEPYQVYHVIQNTAVTHLQFVVRLFDEDTLLSLGDDAISLTPLENDSTDGHVTFKIDLANMNLSQSKDRVTLASGGKPTKCLDAEGKPVALQMKGVPQAWWNTTSHANLTFRLFHAIVD